MDDRAYKTTLLGEELYLIEINCGNVISHDVFHGYCTKDAICIYKRNNIIHCLTIDSEDHPIDRNSENWVKLYELLEMDVEIVLLLININDNYASERYDLFRNQNYMWLHDKYSETNY